MEEAQLLADRAAIIVAGEIVVTGAPSELTARDTATRITYRGEVPPDLDVDASSAEGAVEIRTDRPVEVLHALTAWALSSGRDLDGLRVSTASLEDVYLELTAAQEESPT
jgi:ABC-2 type transport system ATP-binding protein